MSLLGYTAALGRAQPGKMELGQAPDRRIGNIITASFQCDGVGGSSWELGASTSIKFQCDGIGGAAWTMNMGMVFFWECDGIGNCIWISGSGTVRVSCLTDTSTGDPPEAPIGGALYDAPYTY